jgi:hypothetical protein
MFEAMLARLRDPLAPVCTTAIAEKHTRLIEDVQRAGVIHEFPETRVDWTPDGENGSEIPVVRGLAEAFDQSFRERTRLADVFHSTESALLSP